MGVLTKNSVNKGMPSQFTLNRTALSQLPSVIADPYFSDIDNWYKIIFIYKSLSGNQSETLIFNPSTASSIENFYISSTAKDQFELIRADIYDFDHGRLSLSRQTLLAEDQDPDYDVTVEGFISEDYLLTEDNFILLTEDGEQIII